ncbi:flagellar basal body-associated FliL family protein [Algihabitans albus]|uniref:flagellar basal body-associated FliL family protein n=1 Tax=Algihabitans albus TaxID=2164067 RepID=UPI000E5D6BAB|nr:flagellar basal body-associated FliL family protein [Algihabitans albus]
MAEQTMDGQDEDVEVEALPRKGGLSGKKLVLFVVVPLLLIIGGGAGAYFMGVFGGGEEPAAEEQVEEQKEEAHAAIFHDLPDMLVNLNTGGRRSSFLKLSVALELTSDQDMARIQEVQPRIIDSFQVYLRELRIEDLSGSAGLQRLREELLLRVNAAAHPIEVRDVLFKQMLVQ